MAKRHLENEQESSTLRDAGWWVSADTEPRWSQSAAMDKMERVIETFGIMACELMGITG